MKTINRILKELQESYAEQYSVILAGYQERLEDVAMPWEKYLISEQSDRLN